MHVLIDPGCVDINVHPAKREAKFTQEKQVYDAVYFAVLTALNADVSRPVADGSIKRIQPVHTPFGEALVSVPHELADSIPYEQQFIDTKTNQPENKETPIDAPNMPWSYSEPVKKMTLSAPTLVPNMRFRL